MKKTGSKTGDRLIELEQIFRGDHAVIRQGLIDNVTGLPVIQPVWRKAWGDEQARSVILTIAPVEIEALGELAIAGTRQTGPVQGILTWGIEGGDAKQVYFDWGSAVQNPLGIPDGRGSGLQITFPASYVQLDAVNWMGIPLPFGGFDGEPNGVPSDAIVRAFMTVGAATSRLTRIARTLFHNGGPFAAGAGALDFVPAMAKNVQVLRYATFPDPGLGLPGSAMRVKLITSANLVGGNPVDDVFLPIGVRCPVLELTPDVIGVAWAIEAGSADRIRVVFELAI